MITGLPPLLYLSLSALTVTGLIVMKAYMIFSQEPERPARLVWPFFSFLAGGFWGAILAIALDLAPWQALMAFGGLGLAFVVALGYLVDFVIRPLGREQSAQ